MPILISVRRTSFLVPWPLFLASTPSYSEGLAIDNHKGIQRFHSNILSNITFLSRPKDPLRSGRPSERQGTAGQSCAFASHEPALPRSLPRPGPPASGLCTSVHSNSYAVHGHLSKPLQLVTPVFCHAHVPQSLAET